MTRLPFDRVWSPHIGAGGYPWRWRKPAVARVGCDLFADGVEDGLVVEDEFPLAAFGVMAAAPRHTFQVLTERPGRMQRFFQQQDPVSSMKSWARRAGVDVPRPANEQDDWHTGPLPNVWLGVSVEDQRAADERIPHLLRTPAAVRFLSIEPLIEDLGEVDLAGIDWVIVGGESGPNARQCGVTWIRSIVRQCKDAGVACWVKQLGARPVGEWGAGKLPPMRTHPANRGVWVLRDRKGADMDEFPQDLRVRQMPEVSRG